MQIPSALKSALSWLVGVVAFVVCFLAVTVGYMILTHVQAGLLLNLLVFSVVCGLAGSVMMGLAKKLAAWLRDLLGV
jgi:hypothetical protein